MRILRRIFFFRTYFVNIFAIFRTYISFLCLSFRKEGISTKPSANYNIFRHILPRFLTGTLTILIFYHVACSPPISTVTSLCLTICIFCHHDKKSNPILVFATTTTTTSIPYMPFRTMYVCIIIKPNIMLPAKLSMPYLRVSM